MTRNPEEVLHELRTLQDEANKAWKKFWKAVEKAKGEGFDGRIDLYGGPTYHAFEQGYGRTKCVEIVEMRHITTVYEKPEKDRAKDET